MKGLLICLVIVGMGFAQTFGWQNGVPTWLRFGTTPTGNATMIGDIFTVANKFASAGATAYQYFASSAAADTLGFRLTGTSGDRDIVIKLIEEDAAVHTIIWDDALAYWNLGAWAYAGSFKSIQYTTASGNVNYTYENVGDFRIWSSVNGNIDPNISGEGVMRLGMVGDGDDLIIDCDTTIVNGVLLVDTFQYESARGSVRHIAATDTLLLTDYHLVVEAQANVWLPSAAAAYATIDATSGFGSVFGVTLTVAQPCTLYCDGADTINGVDSLIVTRWDSIEVIPISNASWVTR